MSFVKVKAFNYLVYKINILLKLPHKKIKTYFNSEINSMFIIEEVYSSNCSFELHFECMFK